MQHIDFNELKLVRMNANSLVFEGNNGETYLCHRRVVNEIKANPKLPVFVVERELRGEVTNWIAVPLTM